MLKDKKGNILQSIIITKELRNEMLHYIQKGILKKLKAASKLIEIDKEVSAGLYVYAIEELGKILLVTETKSKDSRYIVTYKDEFVNHKKKFETAFDYLQRNNHGQCIIINNEGSFNARGFGWRSFKVGLLANTKARLSIFYSDFEYSSNNKKDENIIVEKIPNVTKERLENAINELEDVIESEFESKH
jgi:AbiV family abortive infection protein